MKAPVKTSLGALWLLTLGVVLSACGSPIVGVECASGYTRCGDECVDLSVDPSHCGTCELRCAAGDVCGAGTCAPPGDSGTDAGPDGGDAGPDAGDAGPDGGDAGDTGVDSGDGGGGDGGGDGGPGDGGGDGGCVCDLGELCCAGVCVTPRDDPNHCGSCDVACAPSELCSAGSCAAACEPGLTLCGGRCVDLMTDPNHCGRCAGRCGSGICVDGVCETATGGHLIVLGHDYRNARRDMNRLVGNGVFLAPGAPVRVLVYEGASRASSLTGVDRAIDQVATARGRTWSRSVATLGDVPLLLSDADVFVIPSQQDASDAELMKAGEQWSRALRSFLERGGVVVLMDGGAMVNAGTWQILDVAGLFAATGIVDVSLANLAVVARTDGIALGMPAMYRGERSTVRFLTSEGTVVVEHPEGPVVIHRLVVP